MTGERVSQERKIQIDVDLKKFTTKLLDLVNSTKNCHFTMLDADEFFVFLIKIAAKIENLERLFAITSEINEPLKKAKILEFIYDYKVCFCLDFETWGVSRQYILQKECVARKDFELFLFIKKECIDLSLVHFVKNFATNEKKNKLENIYDNLGKIEEIFSSSFSSGLPVQKLSSFSSRVSLFKENEIFKKSNLEERGILYLDCVLFLSEYFILQYKRSSSVYEKSLVKTLSLFSNFTSPRNLFEFLHPQSSLETRDHQEVRENLQVIDSFLRFFHDWKSFFSKNLWELDNNQKVIHENQEVKDEINVSQLVEYAKILEDFRDSQLDIDQLIFFDYSDRINCLFFISDPYHLLCGIISKSLCEVRKIKSSDILIIKRFFSEGNSSEYKRYYDDIESIFYSTSSHRDLGKYSNS